MKAKLKINYTIEKIVNNLKRRKNIKKNKVIN